MAAGRARGAAPPVTPRTGQTPRVALVTCRELPGGDAETQLLAAALAQHGSAPAVVVWDDRTVDWRAFHLVIVRNCWDYPFRLEEFLAWAAQVPRLRNAHHVLAWNTDKRYLAQLASAGVPTVPTTWLAPTDAVTPSMLQNVAKTIVVKPAVSLAALDTGRYELDQSGHQTMALAHVRRLQSAGRTVMVQPYLRAIEVEGETSMVFIAGRFSHAMSKAPVLDGPDRGVDRRFAHDGGLQLAPCLPNRGQLELARRALAIVPGGAAAQLYARVDLIPSAEGSPVVLEVELTEPVLYLAHVPEALARFADAVSAAAQKREHVSLSR